jgi:hypothetical protein
LSKLALGVSSICICLLTVATQAQQFDGAFGIGGVKSTTAANAANNYSPQSVGGGTFLGFSGDFLFPKHYGIEGEVFWRAKQNTYNPFISGQPFRPIFWDFNGIYERNFAKRVGVELLAGIGEESVRFYQPFITCSFTSCTNYTSVGHFMGDFGGGLRLYVTPNVFVRPEARVYLIRNNFEFSSGHAERFSVSIGYTFGGSQ